MDLLLSTFRSLRAHALRFFLTSLGIVWGAFLLIYLTAAMEGADDHFTRELEETGPKIVIGFPGSVIKNRVGERGARRVELEIEDIERLQKIQMLEDVAPEANLWNQIIRANGRTKLLTVNAVTERSDEIRSLQPALGRFITQTDVERSARVAYLGDVASTRLFGNEPPIGRTIQIESIRFRVIGVNQAKGDQMIGVNGWDDWVIFIPYSTAQRWFVKHDRVEELIFAPVSRDESWAAIREVREVLGLHHGFDPDLDTAIGFFNVHDIMQILHTIFFGLRFFLVSAGVITLLVGGIGVMNIMLVVVGERTNEIGLRKAVGASSRAIFVQFLAEATAVCVLSGLLGGALGIGFTRIVAIFRPAGTTLVSAPVISWFAVVAVVISLVLVGIIAGVIPAVRAARVPPAEALRAT